MKKYENRHYEDSLKRHNATPIKRETYRGQEILLADSGPHYDPENDPELKDEVEEWKDGYYASVAIVKGKIASFVTVAYFHANHNPELSTNTRLHARVNTAYAKAKEHIDNGIEGGMYQ